MAAPQHRTIHVPARLNRRFALFARVGLAVIGLAQGSPPCRAAELWVEQRMVGPFVCRADYVLADADGLFRELEQLQGDLTKLLGVKPAQETIELCLFRDEQAYHDYLRGRVMASRSRRALFVKSQGVGHVYVYRGEHLRVDVRHECTHALLHAALPMVPLWLDEGLAEYFEVARGQRAEGSDHAATIRRNAWLGLTPSLERLERKRDLDSMKAGDYRAAWAWVHFMLHGPPEAKEELLLFLADIGNRTPPGQLSKRLERRLPNLKRQLRNHFKHWKPPKPPPSPKS